MRTTWREADDVWVCGPYSDPGGQGEVPALPTDNNQQGTMATTNIGREHLHPPVRYLPASPVLYSNTPGLYPVVPSQEWVRFDLAFVDHVRHKAPRDGTWKGRQRKATVMFYLLGVLLIFFSVAVIITFIVYFSGSDIEKKKGTLYEPNMEFSIATTWDARALNHTPVQVTLSRHSSGNDVKIHVEAPFYNNPPNPGGVAGEPFPQLYNYEVVEVLFLNDRGDYLEVGLGPHGQHLVRMLRGEKNSVKEQLALSYTATITGGNIWRGDAIVPGEYFPEKVTKFNAHAIYGSSSNRVYESLYPVPRGQYQEADIHRLAHFKMLDFQRLLPQNHESGYKSSKWSSVQIYPGEMEFSIATTWDSQPVDHTPVKVTLSRHIGGNDVNIHVDAPFFNDPPNPGGAPGQPFPKLYNYEVVEAFFLNDQDDYLEVELSPHAQHLVLMLRGERNAVRQQLPISYTASKHGNTWQGDAIVPGRYFPRDVTKFNAYAIHGTDPHRVYESLYPVPAGKYPAPDFHKLAYFRTIDFQSILPSNHGDGYHSPEWSAVPAHHHDG